MITVKIAVETLDTTCIIIPTIAASKSEKRKFTVEFGWIKAVLAIEISWKNGKE